MGEAVLFDRKLGKKINLNLGEINAGKIDCGFYFAGGVLALTSYCDYHGKRAGSCGKVQNRRKPKISLLSRLHLYYFSAYLPWWFRSSLGSSRTIQLIDSHIQSIIYVSGPVSKTGPVHLRFSIKCDF